MPKLRHLENQFPFLPLPKIVRNTLLITAFSYLQPFPRAHRFKKLIKTMNNLFFKIVTKSMTQLLPIRTFTCCIITLLLINFCQTTTAQQRLGLANSNYGGITNLMSNPADIAGGRYRTYIGAGQADFHLTNNYFKLNNFNLDFLDNADSVTLLKKNGDYLSLGYDLAGLSWIQSINPKITVGLSSRARGTLQGVGITRNFYNTSGISNDSVSTVKGASLNVNAQIFSEIALSYAQTLVDNKDYGVKVGATIKRLSGAVATGFSVSQLDAKYTKSFDNEKYQITSGQLNVAYIGDGSFDGTNAFKPSDIFGSGGKGWGFDVGATYEHRTGNFNESDGTIPYKFRVGVSVTDLGGIKYSGSNVRYYSKDLKNVTFDISDSVDVGQSNDILEAAGVNKDSFATSFTAQIPTMLRVNADVRLSNIFFININWANSLADKYRIGTQYASFIAVTPRLETRYFDFSIPLALSNNYKTFGMGFGIRLGPVTLGMDNFTGLFGNPSGINAHAGLNIGIGRRKNAQNLAEKEKEKEKEAEVAEAKTESKEKSKKKSKKSPTEAPPSNEPMQAPVVVEAPKSIETPAPKAKEIAENTPSQNVVIAKPTAPKMEGNKQKSPEKVPNLIISAPKPTVSTTPTTVVKPVVKPTETPTKAPTTVVAAPKSTAPTTATTVVKPAETSVKTSPQGPLSTTPQKAPTVTVVAPKATVPTVIALPKSLEMKPLGSGRMGECIEFFPNKAAISGNSTACLREISKFLMSNKDIKLNVAASVLSTEKTADATALKTERAKTIRNFLIQSGVDAKRIAIKMSDAATDAPITLTPQ